MDTEYECPDCGTLHYAPTPVECDCSPAMAAALAEDDRPEAIPHAATCPCHDCFTSRDGQAR